MHRDFKPANVLLGRCEVAKVTDFGLASAFVDGDAAVETDERDPSSSSDALAVRLTRTGAILGTPAYMAPEQFEGRQADTRTDVFCFCVALFEALHGARPFRGSTIPELVTSVTSGLIVSDAAGPRRPRLAQRRRRARAASRARGALAVDGFAARGAARRSRGPASSSARGGRRRRYVYCDRSIDLAEGSRRPASLRGRGRVDRRRVERRGSREGARRHPRGRGQPRAGFVGARRDARRRVGRALARSADTGLPGRARGRGARRRARRVPRASPLAARGVGEHPRGRRSRRGRGRGPGRGQLAADRAVPRPAVVGDAGDRPGGDDARARGGRAPFARARPGVA